METCKNCLHYDICTFHVTGNENEKCTHYMPTTDVVPKSEVVLASSDAVKMLIECHGYALTHDEDVKREVAREIFEEIEKIATSEGAYDYVSIQEIAEIKEKYTENKE